MEGNYSQKRFSRKEEKPSISSHLEIANKGGTFRQLNEASFYNNTPWVGGEQCKAERKSLTPQRGEGPWQVTNPDSFVTLREKGRLQMPTGNQVSSLILNGVGRTWEHSFNIRKNKKTTAGGLTLAPFLRSM